MGCLQSSVPELNVNTEVKDNNCACPSNCPSSCCVDEKWYCCVILKSQQSNEKSSPT